MELAGLFNLGCTYEKTRYGYCALGFSGCRPYGYGSGKTFQSGESGLLSR
jgi:hypothetical protein